jgi:anti-anti-sigma factor
MISRRSSSGDSIIIRPCRVLDNSNAHEMSKAISQAQVEGWKYIIIDMSELQFLSSAGVGSILGGVGRSRERGGDIILCDLPDKILHVLEILDLCDYLTIKSSGEIARDLCVKES